MTKTKFTIDDVKKTIRSIYEGDKNNAVFENYNEYCKNMAIDNGTFDYEPLKDTAENLEIILNNTDYLMAVADDVMQDVEIEVIKQNKFKHASIYLTYGNDYTTLLRTQIDDEQDIYYWDSIYHEEGFERKDYTTRLKDNITIEQTRRYTKENSNVYITMIIYYKEECKNC